MTDMMEMIQKLGEEYNALLERERKRKANQTNAIKKYHEKMKNCEEYMEKNRARNRSYYERHRDTIRERQRTRYAQKSAIV